MEIQVLAQRIYDTDPFGMRDSGETAESIAEKLDDLQFCKDTIIYLLDYIDEIMEG